uniref:Uncharacterized protein n=1 Tax=Rhizophora mucronata TaxID=61149 RepID=A0A2P2R178_RHIMU
MQREEWALGDQQRSKRETMNGRTNRK